MASTSPSGHPPTASYEDGRARLLELPIPLTPLLGREREIADVRALLDGDETRLLTLTGPGGTGKTRLALEVASRVKDDFAHGACFVPLASIRDPDLVASTIAQALGVRESDDRPLAEVLTSVLRAQHLLLVLDNLEQVVGAAPWLAELLSVCPRVKALVTSRVPLHVRGEQRCLVPPLPVPDAHREQLVEAVAEYAAVDLFVTRARSVRPGFVFNQTNAGTVVEICRRLEGLPLAIELAAARVNVISPAAILVRLTHRLTLLTGTMRDVPARHQTMRDTIAWSYDLLTVEEQTLFRRLAVFTGGFTLDAAEAVVASAASSELVDGTGSDNCHRHPSTPMLDLIASLVDQSLVLQGSSENDDQRFWMLETIREYGVDQLRARGEERAARDAHAAWYARLGRQSDPTLDGSGQVDWLNRLEREHDNIRGALAWLTARERIEEALDLAGSIWFFRWIRGYYAEGRDQYEDLLAHPLGAGRTLARARGLNGLGIIALHQGDVARSQEAHEEAVSIFRELGEREYLSWALLCLGTCFITSDRLDAGEEVCAESHTLACEIGYAYGIQATCCNLGVTAFQRGEYDKARSLFLDSVDRCRAMGEQWGLSLGLLNLGELSMRDGRVDAAERMFQEALSLIRALGDRRDLPLALTSLAGVARVRGDVAMAQAHLEEALRVARDVGDWHSIAGSLLALAEVAKMAGDYGRSLGFAREGMETFLTMQSPVRAASCVDGVVDIAIATGDMERAARFIGAVDGALEQSGMARWESSPGQHRARVGAISGALCEAGYRRAWSAGHELTVDALIAEALAYEPPTEMASTRRQSPGATGPAAMLSPRELEVLKLIADGLTNREVADALFISHRTATSHASNILGKLGFTSRTAAVAYAIRHGFA